MELIDNKAVKVTVSKQVGLNITAHIDKSKIIKDFNEHKLVDVLINFEEEEFLDTRMKEFNDYLDLFL